MSFDFGNNLRKTIDLSQTHMREFIKKDFKYLIFPLLSIFTFIFGILFIILNAFAERYSTGADLISELLFFLLLSFILFLVSDYLLMWLNASKSYFVERLYNDVNSTYKNSIDETRPFRGRVFIASIIEWAITFALTSVLYLALILILILFSNGHVNLILLLVNTSNFQMIPSLIVGFLLIPLQLYLPIMLIEKNVGYIDGIKRSFKVLSGWQNKAKYLILAGLLGAIIGFIMDFVFLGVFFFSIFGLFFLYFALVKIGITLTGYVGWLVLIFCVSLILAIFFTIFIEILLIATGTMNGQVYVNLVRPELEQTQNQLAKKQSYYPNYPSDNPPNFVPTNPPTSSPGTFCTNCGNQLQTTQKFCPVCGQKVV